MLVLVTYDVRTAEAGGAARLRRVAKVCRDYGQRVQYSVFEIEVDPAQWAKLRAKLEKLIKPEHDSLRYYYLGANWQRRVEHVAPSRPSIWAVRLLFDSGTPARTSSVPHFTGGFAHRRSHSDHSTIPANSALDASSALTELLIRAEGTDFFGQRMR